MDFFNKKKTTKKKNSKPPSLPTLSSLGLGPKPFKGTGSALGGGDRREVLVRAVFEGKGSMGCSVEMTGTGGTVVTKVEPGGQVS